ncbi:MAG: glycosyltransferase [Cyanobacteria bacterium J06627_28]
MNLFIIPSWYPSQRKPLAGIFIKEQVDAIAACLPNTSPIVSTWGHDDGRLSPSILKHPKQLVQIAQWRIKPHHSVPESHSNGKPQDERPYEVFHPAISWSHRLPFGGVRRLLNVNRKNFRLATQRYGKIDLIHAHVSYPAGYIASVLKQEFGVPYVLTEHMGPFPLPTFIGQDGLLPEIKTAFDSADAVIAVSPYLADSVEKTGLRRPVVIPNLVNENRFTPAPSPDTCFTFLALCLMVETKGIDHLLHALARWNPPANQVQLKIGGDGPMLKPYRALAHRLGLEDRVFWLGYVRREQVPQLFQSCHAYVLPSHQETFGLVYAEAIASGKPVIATRCGGPESIINHNNGRLVDVGDVAGLAKTMAWMAQHWDAFEPQKIREDFESRFSQRAVVEKLARIYAEVIGGSDDSP